MGQGANKRYETTTSHSKALQTSDLPSSVQDVISTDEAAKEWNPMITSGIHKTSDLTATPESDDLIRLGKVLHKVLQWPLADHPLGKRKS